MRSAVRSGGLVVAVLAVLWALWEAFKWFGETTGFRLGAFEVNDRTLPHLHDIVGELFEPSRRNGPLLIDVLLGWGAVAVIAAYLTFFPVAINTLRGLQSADPRALELMRSYAANRWRVLWKLRVPASLPYLFAALKISATASVVGAIIGELPASIQDGLGGAILNFNQYYSTTPENLWATNLVAAALGIAFFGA